MAGILRDAALSALAVWEALSATIVPDDGAGLLSPRLADDVSAIQAAMAELRRLLPAPARDYDPRPYIAANHWVFARTMPDNPHEYVVIHNSTDPYEHLIIPRVDPIGGGRRALSGPRLRVRDRGRVPILGHGTQQPRAHDYQPPRGTLSRS